MTWNLISNCQEVTWLWCHSKKCKNVFFPKDRDFTITEKTIKFGSAFKKDVWVIHDFTKKRKVPKFVILGGKDCKLKVIELYSKRFSCFSWDSFNKICFFIAFWNWFFNWTIFFNSRFKNKKHICKIDHLVF